MIESILTLLASPVLGSISGMIGNWIQKKQEIEIIKEQNNQQYKMSMLDSENKRREIESQSKADGERLDGEAFVKAQDTPKTGWAAGLMSAVRVLVTTYLLIFMTYLAYEVNTLVGGLETLPMEVLIDMYGQIIFSIIYLTITAITFWFGQRPSQTFRMVGAPKS